jgi:flagellar hook-associated protein 3 FlgL
MITRVTDNIKFNMLTNNLFNVSGKYGELMEKISTGKNINRPSDDPIGTNDILDFRTVTKSIEQYQSNITDANIWLNLSSTNLSGLSKIVDEAKSIAISESGASGSSETRQASLATLNSMINEALSLLNAKNGDNYLFGGSSTDVQPFSAGYEAASITVSAGETNTYSGAVSSVGTYIPTESKSYIVKIVDGGTLAAATYKVSTDGGTTWGATSIAGDLTAGTINNLGGDDIDLTFPAGTFAANDTFTVHAPASVSVSPSTTNSFNGTVTPSGPYTGTENKNYALKIVTGGALAAATYKISADGGKTWGDVQTDLSGMITVGDGIKLTFAAGSIDLAPNDTFTVKGNAAGYYRGNNDEINTVIGNDNNMAYNITGAEAFTGQFASASVTNGGSGLTADGSIVLTRGATAADWTVTTKTGYPNMNILSATATTVTIDADSTTVPPTADITINLTGTWSQNDTINFSPTAGIASGEIPTTFNGSGSIDLLSTLNALKTALEEPDQGRAQDLIAAQVDNLINAGTQMLQYETQAGAKMRSLETTSSNHDSLNLQVTNMLSDIETADMTKLIMEFQMKQIAMQASYSMASQIGKLTIMNYIS